MIHGERRRLGWALLAAALCAGSAGRAAATQYDVVDNFNTAPFTGGEAYAIDHGVVVGGYFKGAALWPTPGQLIPLGYPSGWQGSLVYGVSGNQQVGTGVAPDSNSHALLWEGTAASVVDLTPGTIGWADATDGAQQVGFTRGGAALWAGTAASYVSLAPSAYGYSEAHAVWGGVQVGWGAAEAGTNNADALLWHGTASGYTVLKTGAKAFGISRGQVVGWWENQAAIWNGFTPDAFVNVNPPSATASELFGTNGTQQVGNVSLTIGSFGQLPVDHHPGVWRGSISSFQMLPLPQGDNGGFAYGIDGSGNIVGVVGVQDAGAFEGAAPIM